LLNQNKIKIHYHLVKEEYLHQRGLSVVESNKKNLSILIIWHLKHSTELYYKKKKSFSTKWLHVSTHLASW